VTRGSVRCRFLISGVIVFTVAAIPRPSAFAAGGQTAGAAGSASPSAQGRNPTNAQAAKAVPRTADGQPDIRGVWSRDGGALQESNPPPAVWADGQTAQGDQAFGVNAEPVGFSNVTNEVPKIGPDRPRRPVGVVDPADKVLPWRPEADARRREHLAKMGTGWSYLETTARCAPPPPWVSLNPAARAPGAVHILQRPGEVVMLFEYDHASRSIALDGRPRLGATPKLFMGDAVGRWEGNTLVVETTNLNGHAQFGRAFPYYSDAMRLTERFTIIDENTIDWEVVYDDPKLFTRPIKSVGYLSRGFKDYEIYEAACAEGSQTLQNIFGF
jgi:hypothetical protein